MVGDYSIPVMYQDLASYSMNHFAMPIMPGMPVMYGGNTSYLNGAKIAGQLDQDRVELMNKKTQEGNSTAKKVALALGALLLIGFIPKLFGKQSVFSKLGNWATTKFPQLNNAKAWVANKWTAFKNLFKKSAPAPATP